MAKKKKSKSTFRQKYDKEAMVKRTKEAYDSRESSGKYGDYFTDNMPLTKKKMKNGDHIIDIIPYIAGENNPSVTSDAPTYKLDVWVHTNVGPKEGMYVCPARNFDKPCPICEEIARLRKEEDTDDADHEDEIKALNPKRRCAYNIICYDSAKEEEEGVVLFEVSHYLFETELNAVSKKKRTGGFVPFSDPDEGKTIEFTKEGERRTTKFKGFQLTDREESVTDEILDDAICIEDYIETPSYAELAKIAGLKVKKAVKEEEPEEEPEEEEEEEEPEEEEPEEEEPEEEPEEEAEEEEDSEEDDIPFEEASRLKKDSKKSSKSKSTDEKPKKSEKTKTTRRRRK